MRKEHRVTFRLGEDTYDALNAYAIKKDVTLSEAIRRLMEARLKGK